MTRSIETLQALIDGLAEEGEREAVCELAQHGLVRWRYHELTGAARRLGAGLAAAGVERGEPVGLLAPNSAEWVVACLAILEAGAVVTPFDTQMPAAELRHALADSGVRYLFTAGEAARRLETLGLEDPPEPIRLDDEGGTAGGWQAWCRGGAERPRTVAPEEAAALFYTSGTTGEPKGVPLTHANIAANLTALLGQELAYGDDRILVPLPYHHVYPFTVGLLTPLALGASIVLPYSVLGPQIVRALREGEATILIGVPRLYEALDGAIRGRLAERGGLTERAFEALLGLSRGARRRLGWRLGPYLFRGLHQRMAPSLRMAVSGGAPLPPELAERLRALGWEVATGYGLTETSPILTYNPPDRIRVDSAGLTLPGVELRIDAEGEGGPGEVLARGPNVFAGYRHLPEKSARAFTAEGFYRTGDLGWIDGDGYLHLEGRASEMIVLAGGENIDPERVEKALTGAEAIRDAGVLAHDGRLVAVLYPEPEAVRGLDEAGVRRRLNEALQACGEQLPSHHRIGDYRISPEPLPRTRLGKLRRHKLRERYEQLGAEGAAQAGGAAGPMDEEAMAAEDQQLLQIPAARRVWEALAARYADRRLTPDTHLQLDLGIDSLGWIDLTLELRERTAVALDEDAISRIASVRDLLREAAESQEARGEARALLEELRDPEQLLNEAQLRWLAPRPLAARALGGCLYAINWAILHGYCRLAVERSGGRLPEGPVVLVPNHRSALDAPALGAALPLSRLARTFWAGFTGLLFGNRLVRWFSRASRVLPIDPYTGPRTSLAFGAAALARGESLVWFAEGQRSNAPRIQPFHSGIGLLLQAHPTPAVPVHIAGTERALPIGRRFPARGSRLRVRFGEAVDPQTLLAEGRGETAEERIADALQRRVAALGGAEEEQA